MRYHQRAICLRAIDFSETSQVLTLLTRDEGKVRLMAKGTKRPKSKTGGAIDLLAEGTVVYSLLISMGEGKSFATRAILGACNCRSATRKSSWAFCRSAARPTTQASDSARETTIFRSTVCGQHSMAAEVSMPKILSWSPEWKPPIGW